MLITSSLAMAAPEIHQVGPYTVSFDMNTNMNYEVRQESPMQTDFAVAYPLLIVTDNSTAASIFVTEYNDLTDSTATTAKQIVRLTTLLRGFNVTSIDDLTIDSLPGFLVSGSRDFNGNAVSFFEAMYWLDSIQCNCGPLSAGKINIDLSSTYPQDVTMGILNSLRVVKGEPEETVPAQAGPVDMPPADMPTT